MNTSSWRAERQAEVASEWGVYDLCGRTDSAVPFVERLTTLLNISVWNQQCIADALNVVAAMSSVCTSVANYVSSVVRGCKPELSLDGRLGVRGTTKEQFECAFDDTVKATAVLSRLFAARFALSIRRESNGLEFLRGVVGERIAIAAASLGCSITTSAKTTIFSTEKNERNLQLAGTHGVVVAHPEGIDTSEWWEKTTVKLSAVAAAGYDVMLMGGRSTSVLSLPVAIAGVDHGAGTERCSSYRLLVRRLRDVAKCENREGSVCGKCAGLFLAAVEESVPGAAHTILVPHRDNDRITGPVRVFGVRFESTSVPTVVKSLNRAPHYYRTGHCFASSLVGDWAMSIEDMYVGLAAMADSAMFLTYLRQLPPHGSLWCATHYGSVEALGARVRALLLKCAEECDDELPFCFWSVKKSPCEAAVSSACTQHVVVTADYINPLFVAAHPNTILCFQEVSGSTDECLVEESDRKKSPVLKFTLYWVERGVIGVKARGSWYDVDTIMKRVGICHVRRVVYNGSNHCDWVTTCGGGCSAVDRCVLVDDERGCGTVTTTTYGDDVRVNIASLDYRERCCHGVRASCGDDDECERTFQEQLVHDALRHQAITVRSGVRAMEAVNVLQRLVTSVVDRVVNSAEGGFVFRRRKWISESSDYTILPVVLAELQRVVVEGVKKRKRGGSRFRLTRVKSGAVVPKTAAEFLKLHSDVENSPGWWSLMSRNWSSGFCVGGLFDKERYCADLRAAVMHTVVAHMAMVDWGENEDWANSLDGDDMCQMCGVLKWGSSSSRWTNCRKRKRGASQGSVKYRQCDIGRIAFPCEAVYYADSEYTGLKPPAGGVEASVLSIAMCEKCHDLLTMAATAYRTVKLLAGPFAVVAVPMAKSALEGPFELATYIPLTAEKTPGGFSPYGSRVRVCPSRGSEVCGAQLEIQTMDGTPWMCVDSHMSHSIDEDVLATIVEHMGTAPIAAPHNAVVAPNERPGANLTGTCTVDAASFLFRSFATRFADRSSCSVLAKGLYEKHPQWRVLFGRVAKLLGLTVASYTESEYVSSVYPYVNLGSSAVAVVLFTSTVLSSHLCAISTVSASLMHSDLPFAISPERPASVLVFSMPSVCVPFVGEARYKHLPSFVWSHDGGCPSLVGEHSCLESGVPSDFATFVDVKDGRFNYHSLEAPMSLRRRSDEDTEIPVTLIRVND